MLKRILILIILSKSLDCFAQHVTIKGSAKSYEYQEINVWRTADYISNMQKELTYSDIDSSGNFMLEFDTKEIEYVTLKIGKNIASMYIEPNENYDVKILAPDSTTYQNPNLEHDVKLLVSLKSKTEINALTIDYDNRFNNFLDQDYIEFLKRAPKAKIDSFAIAMSQFYSSVQNNYFNGYMTYTLASLEENSKMSNDKLFEKYVSKKPIRYTNPEYMNFFNSFYKDFLHNFTMSKDGFPLSYQLSDRASLSGTINILRRDKFINNDTLAELVLLKGLYECYFDKSFKIENILAILAQVEKESVVAEHKQIAKNITNSFSKLKVGSLAPYFQLPDKIGVSHNLDDLRNKKFVYLMFFDKTCSTCLQQMKIISTYKKKYGESINFVSISTDKNLEELKSFTTLNPKYDWLFLFDNTTALLKNNYEIKTLPAYFLINPDGKFVQMPTESPDEGIDRAFFDITKPKVKKLNIGLKDDK